MYLLMKPVSFPKMSSFYIYFFELLFLLYSFIVFYIMFGS